MVPAYGAGRRATPLRVDCSEKLGGAMPCDKGWRSVHVLTYCIPN